MGYTKKQREECVLFLDDCFGRLDLPKHLRDAGYNVEAFRDHSQDSSGSLEQGTKDPDILRLCQRRGWTLVTADSEMQYTHVEAIKKTTLLILATAHNSSADMSVWASALIKLKPSILRLHKKEPRPCFVTFSQNGNITQKRLITSEMTTRRKRPGEGA